MRTDVASLIFKKSVPLDESLAARIGISLPLIKLKQQSLEGEPEGFQTHIDEPWAIALTLTFLEYLGTSNDGVPVKDASANLGQLLSVRVSEHAHQELLQFAEDFICEQLQLPERLVPR